MTEYAQQIAPTNDILFRRLIMQHYQDCMTYGTQLMVYVTAEIRRGTISSRADPFKLALANLVFSTENIKSMNQYKDKAEEINAWLQQVPPRSRKLQTEHYLKGIRLMKDWSKTLIAQSIIEFR